MSVVCNLGMESVSLTIFRCVAYYLAIRGDCSIFLLPGGSLSAATSAVPGEAERAEGFIPEKGKLGDSSVTCINVCQERVRMVSGFLLGGVQ